MRKVMITFKFLNLNSSNSKKILQKKVVDKEVCNISYVVLKKIFIVKNI